MAMAGRALAHPLLVGAVIHDGKTLDVWERLKTGLADHGCRIDYVFFSNYKTQVDALVSGHVDLAWNSPLAWLDTVRRTDGRCDALAMRDTDRDRLSHLIVRTADGLTSVDALRGKTIAVGAADSPHSTLLPLHLLRGHGMKVDTEIALRRFGETLGVHGERTDDERQALRALEAGACDAAAVLDLHWNTWLADGTVDGDRLTVLASTPPFDRSNFTVLAGFPARATLQWTDALFSLRPALDPDGAATWLPGRRSGYAMLSEAVRDARVFEQDRPKRHAAGGKA